VALEDSDFTVLHGLALRRRTGVDGLARTTGLERAAIEQALGRARDANLVAAARGDYFLTPDGEEVLRRAYPKRFAESRQDPGLAVPYERFETVNRAVKVLVTQWQVRPIGETTIPNDHSDAEYDDGILDRLRELHERAENVLASLSAGLPRMARYADRLQAALEQAEAGAHEWVSGVHCDSYHGVWFELHEDLLRVLGKSREE
jgi:hypothetical protein